MKHIHGYYSPNNLYNKIIEGLNEIGKDLSKVTLDDLQPVDEFHIRGDLATKELIELSGFSPGIHDLRVVGGTAEGVWLPSEEAVLGQWTVDPSWPSIRISEVLARNDAAVEHGE